MYTKDSKEILDELRSGVVEINNVFYEVNIPTDNIYSCSECAFHKSIVGCSEKAMAACCSENHKYIFKLP